MQSPTKTILILGGDGYLGWSLGLAFAHRTDMNVVLVDNLIKRRWEKEVSAKTLIPLKHPYSKIEEYRRIFGKSNLSFEEADLLQYESVVRLIKKYRPYAIVNAAQQPSAPFSMISANHASLTFSNNILGNLNILWAIAETDKNIQYIKLGSTGVYMSVDSEFVPLKRVDMQFKYNEQLHSILNAWHPMEATDFYHQSKIDDFLISDLCVRIWKLKMITVQQSTIFGATIPENDSPENHILSTRFNYDHIFGTVLNRFVCQIAADHPITVYGDGSQKTGLVSLADTVDNFLKFIDAPVEPGVHKIEHNYSHRLSIKEIAEKLMAISGYKNIEFMKNPRIESENHLKKEVEVSEAVLEKHADKDKNLADELERFFNFAKRYKENIEKSILLPTVQWQKNPAQEAQPPYPERESLFNFNEPAPKQKNIS